jgi:hypothetical protein
MSGLTIFHNKYDIKEKSSATVLVGYLEGTWRNLRFPLILVVNFYYIINKLIILVSGPH